MNGTEPTGRELNNFPINTSVNRPRARRQNREISVKYNISSITKAFFCLTSPCGSCDSVTVKPNHDVIITRYGIPQNVLRGAGLHPVNPCGLEMKEVDVRSYYMDLSKIRLNDKRGMPLLITSQYSYQVRDSFLAVNIVTDYQKMIFKLAKSALHIVVPQYPFTCGKSRETTLQSRSPKIDQNLKDTLAELVKPFGIQINYFRLKTIEFDQEMEKLLLAKQEAEAYIKGRNAIAKSAIGIVEDTLASLNERGIELSDENKRSLVTHLIFMITHQSDMDFNIFQLNQTPTHLVMERK